MLQQITQIVRDEQPDAMVISGDVFDTGNPSAAVQKLYNDTMLDIHFACPTMTIVVTAGNHDSPSRLTVADALWDKFNVTVLGSIARHEDGTPDLDAHIIKVLDKGGSVKGFIAAVPHCYVPNFPAVEENLDRTERMPRYFQALLDRVKELNVEQMPVVLMAHLAVNGTDFAGHDMIGGMETTDIACVGKGYDYLALGHIHSPQNIAQNVRYCGTPVPVDFGEKFEHSVSIVTVNHGETPVVETKRIKNIIPLHDFPTPVPSKDSKEEDLPEGKRPLPFSEVLKRLRNYPADEKCYLRVVVKVDDSLTSLCNAQIADAIRGKQCRFCRMVSVEYAKEENNARENRINVSQMRSMEPVEIADRYYAIKQLEFSDQLRKLMQEATQQVKEEENED
jgi:exonuclease SbcD